MREITVCKVCGSKDIDYKGRNKCYCNNCKKETDSKDIYVQNPYERQEAMYMPQEINGQ